MATNNQILYLDPLSIFSFPTLKCDQNQCLTVSAQAVTQGRLELHL